MGKINPLGNRFSVVLYNILKSDIDKGYRKGRDWLTYIYYRARWNYQSRLGIAKLLNVDLELSSKCNLRCPMCYHSNQKSITWKQDFMDTTLAFRILNMCKDEHVPAVKFNFRGEPTLHPSFESITAYAHSLGILDRLVNTNLQFNDPNKLLGLLHCTKIIVSIDATDEETYKICRGGNWVNFSRNLNALHDLVTPKNKLILQIVQQEGNQGKLNLEKLVRQYPRANVSLRKIFPRGLGEISRHDNLKRKICQYPFNRLVITHDGNCLPCCPDFNEQYVLGNIRESNNLNDIFNNELSCRLRELILRKQYDCIPCRDCKSWISYKT